MRAASEFQLRSKASCRDQLVPERQPVRGRLIARQISIREAKYEKLVRIRYRRRIGGEQQEIVVVGNPQRVKPGVVIEPDIRTERNALDLRRDAIGGDTIAGKRRDEIQEQSFGDSVRGCGEPVLVGDIYRAVEVDLKEVFYPASLLDPSLAPPRPLPSRSSTRNS